MTLRLRFCDGANGDLESGARSDFFPLFLHGSENGGS